MSPEPHALLIGDTILNRTYYARPAGGLSFHAAPFSFTNEEYLELAEAPGRRQPVAETTVQGIGYIARYLGRCRSPRQVTAWTDLGHSEELDRVVRESCHERSVLHLGCLGEHVAVRVLRDVTLSRVGGHDMWRPQLRIDTPPRGPARELESAMATADVSGASLGLIRASGAEFFAHPWSGAPRPQAADLRRVADRIGDLQRWLHQRQVRAVIDLRPIPPELRIVEPETVLCTTIGRLRDYWDLVGAADIATAEPERVVREAFWRLAPVQAIVCYAGRAGTIVCRRGGHATESVLQRIEMVWPPDPHGNLGMVTGGDAFVAGLIDGLLDQPDDPVGEPVGPTRRCWRRSPCPWATPSTRSTSARPSPRRAPSVPGNPPSLTTRGSRSWAGSSTGSGGQDELMTVPGLITPEGGALATALDTLGRALDRWAPEKGKDLIAVFGESRSGKEYALARLLRSKEYTYVGPVNMHQFLQETGSIIDRLKDPEDPADRRPPAKRALLIDEIQPGDMARPLLNLMAEKSYFWYPQKKPLGFEEHPVFLLTSIEEGRLLDDLQGRVFVHVVVPPLRDRQEEVPFLLPRPVALALGQKELGDRMLRVGLRCLDALMAYDYLPRPNPTHELGLNQRNFRALEDLIRGAVRKAEQDRRVDAALVVLKVNDLPRSVAALAAEGVTDNDFLEYPAHFQEGTYPQIRRSTT